MSLSGKVTSYPFLSSNKHHCTGPALVYDDGGKRRAQCARLFLPSIYRSFSTRLAYPRCVTDDARVFYFHFLPFQPTNTRQSGQMGKCTTRSTGTFSTSKTSKCMAVANNPRVVLHHTANRIHATRNARLGKTERNMQSVLLRRQPSIVLQPHLKTIDLQERQKYLRTLCTSGASKRNPQANTSSKMFCPKFHTPMRPSPPCWKSFDP